MTRNREHADIQRHIDNRKELGDDAPPMLYRRDLLKRAKHAIYGLGFRDIARATNLSVNTVQQAFDGDAAKVTTLWVLARYFGIPWLALFDLEKKISIDKPALPPVPAGTIDLGNGRDPKRYVIVAVDPSIISDESPRVDPPTSKKALGSKAAKPRGGKTPGASGIYGSRKVKK
jgi:transcriptional regulator with XRE-family HTH domain